MGGNPKTQNLMTVGLVLLSLLLFYPGLFFLRGAWVVGDHAEQHYPWAIYLAENIKQFHLPFITNLLQSGFPIAAEGQIGIFYLPNLLFYFPFPIEAGYAWSILFHLLLSGIFMAAFLRSLNLSEKAVGFGVLVYLYSSALGGAFYNITSLKVLCWFPAALLAVDAMWKGGRFHLKAVPVLGFLFSLQILAGYLQFATYAIFFALLYGILRAWESLEEEKRPFVGVACALGVSVLIAAVLSFPQLILTFKLAMSSNRSGVAESFAYIGSFPPFALICLIFPSLEGLFAGKLYLGILPLFFVIAALSQWPQKPFRSILILAAISLLLALGQFSPLYVFIVKVLHFHSFRTPIKFIFFLGFFSSVLAAYGIDLLLKGEKERIQKAFSFYAGALILSILAVVISYAAFRFFAGTLNQLGEWLVTKFIYGKPGHPYGWEHYEEKLRAFISTSTQLLNPRSSIIGIPLLKAGISLAALSFFLKNRAAKASLFYFMILGLAAADLYTYSFADVQRDYAPYETFYRETPTTQFLKEHLQGSRYFIFSNDPSSSPVPMGKNMRLHLKTANAYSPLVSKKYYDYMGALGGVNDSTGSFPIDETYLQQNLDKLQRLSVRYVVTDRELDTILGAPVFTENRWRTYFIQNPKPAFYWKEETGTANIRILKDDESEISLEVIATSDQALIVSRLFDPGWRVFINGKSAAIQSYEIFLAIPITAGKHAVTLRYQPFHDTVPFLKNLLKKDKA